MPTFERGFKTWAERCSVELRKELGHKPDSPLSLIQLARHIGVQVTTPNRIKNLPVNITRQLSTDEDGWSAMSLNNRGQDIIVINHRHSLRRRASNLAHELSHLIIGHEPSKVYVFTRDLRMREYDQKVEAEADWLAGCLLLPRPACLRIKQKRIVAEDVCRDYRVSEQMLRWRLSATGVNRQYQRTRKAQRP